MFQSMSISKRLVLLAVVVVISIVIVMVLSAKVQGIQNDLSSIERSLSKIEVAILIERKYEKDFLARKNPKYIDKFNKKMQELEKEIVLLENKLNIRDIDVSEDLKILKTNLKIYKSKFHDIVKVYNLIGLDPKSGYRGSLREAIHKVESSLNGINNYKVISQMLMLRRNEKDFLLRMDEKYLAKHAKNMQMIYTSIKQFKSVPYKIKVMTLMKQYEKGFITLASLYKKLGYNEKSGLLGVLRNAIHTTDTSLNNTLKNSREKLNATLATHLTYYYLTVFGMMISGFIFIWFLITSITKPMRRISKEIRDNKNDLTQKYIYKGKDELGIMVEAINTFSAKLNEAVTHSKKTSLENVSVAAELSATSMSIGDSLKESVNIVDETTKNAVVMNDNMAKTLEETSLALDEMTYASSTMTEVSSNFNKLIDSIRQSAEVESELSVKLSELSTDAEQVKDILTIISDIADQTNLLALNAAIEAARAGEHGRGFAVVADEVRKLAERTQKSLTEIQASVNVIVQNIVEASSQISINSKHFDTLVESSSVVDEKVEQSTQNMSDALQRVTLASDFTKVTGDGVNEMMSMIHQINDISTINAKSVQEISTATEHLSAKTESLNHQLDFFKTT